MGAFYGSVQIRGEDRDAVQSALAEFSRKTGKKFLLGPPLNGWIGIYSDDSGQNLGLARDLARRLPGEIFAVRVHDNHDFAYAYYHDGEPIDAYDPGFVDFDEVSEQESFAPRWRPESFAHLVSDPAKFAAIKERLAAQSTGRDAWATELLEEFADCLGIRNAVTSYDYLLEDGAPPDIEVWDRFVGVPGPEHEPRLGGQPFAAPPDGKPRLTPAGMLLAERSNPGGSAIPGPCLCPSPDGQGFLVAWGDLAGPEGEQRPLERHGPPWATGPTTTPWVADLQLYGLELSDSGRYLAVASAAGRSRVALWDTQENRLVAATPHGSPANWLGFTPAGLAMVSVDPVEGPGRVLIPPVDGEGFRLVPLSNPKLAAIHPSGASLVAADSLSRLLVVDIATGRIERQIPAHFAAEACRRYFDAPEMEMALRRQMKEVRRIFKRAALPKKLIDGLERGYAGHVHKMGDQAASTVALTAILRMRFDPSGDRLYLGTVAGLRAYSWKEIASADGALPDPIVASAGAGSAGDTGYDSFDVGADVHDLEIDPDHGRVLFAGKDGRVRFLELASGRSGVLLEPSGRPPIHCLALSRDRTALALILQPGKVSSARKASGPVLQFWDYQALVRATS